jgi:two-component system, sensor histidine kinase
MTAMLSSEFVRSALESSPDATIIIDASGTILFANHQLSALFGYHREEVTGMPVENLMPERFRGRHVANRERFAAAERVRPMGQGLDLYGRRKDGTEFPVEISLSPIREGASRLVAAAIRDVTERKRAQVELIAAREAADRARQVADEARDIADRANQAKSRFLATASHDLRQPLQSIALLHGTMRRVLDDRAALEEALDYQDQAIGAMSRLLNALLDISKLESGAIKPNPTDFTVAAVFEELRQEFDSLAASKGLRLLVNSSADCVHSDPSLVGQVLRNLISNAIKYTRQGSVQLRSLRRPQSVRIEVLDTGIGIPADQIPLIYDEFYQVGVDTNTSRDGYGLGLSIVRRIVNLLGIRLDVQSEVGKGSTFAVELPPGAAEASLREVARSAVTTAGRNARRKVLLVEDDLAVRNATRMLLKAEGYEVLTAASLNEAKDLAGTAEIDVLITDYHLSNRETGSQVIASVREIRGQELRAVLLTGDTSSAIREVTEDKLLRIARKPVKAGEFLALIKELLTT